MKTLTTIFLFLVAFAASSQNSFMKTFPYWDRAEAGGVIEQSDGYVLLGVGHFNNGLGSAMFIIKLNFNGDTLWKQEIPVIENEYGISSYSVDEWGNTYVVRYNDGYDIFKFDSQWNLLFETNLGLTSPVRIKVLSDNNLLVICQNWQTMSYVAYKMNYQSHEIIWTSDTITTESPNIIRYIVENTNGELAIVTGNSGMESGFLSSTLYHLSSTGNLLSEHTFDQFVLGTTVFDNGELLSLAYYSNIPGYNALVRFQPNGTVLSTTDISQPDYSFREFVKKGNKLVMTGNYLGGGPDFFDVAIGCMVDNSIAWTYHYSEPGYTGQYIPHDIISTSDNGFLTYGTTNVADIIPFILKIDDTGILGVPEKQVANFTILPNPADSYIQISGINGFSGPVTAELYSAEGALVFSTAVSNPITGIDIHKLSSGLYFLILKSSKGIEVNKIVIE